MKEGDYVSVGQPLVSVTQNRKLFLRADVSEKYYPYLNSIGSANFCTPYNNKVYTLKELGGRMLSYGKASGENGYYVPVTFEFDNKGDVIPGSFVEVFLLSSPMENVLSLPHSALTEEQGSFFVYLQLDEEGYKKQLVTLGADNGESVQILLDDSYELKPVTDFDPRPHVLTLINAEKTVIRDITIRNSAYWTIHLIGCYDALIDGRRAGG